MDDMETGAQSKRSGRERRGGPEPRVMAIEYRPGPHAEARLRRIARILLPTRDPRRARGRRRQGI